MEKSKTEASGVLIDVSHDFRCLRNAMRRISQRSNSPHRNAASRGGVTKYSSLETKQQKEAL